MVHKLFDQEIGGLSFDENTANIIAYCIDPDAWLPRMHSKIIDALDSLTGMPGLLKTKRTKKDNVFLMRLGYSLVMFFTPPRLRPMSGMLWMWGRTLEAQAPGNSFVCWLVCPCRYLGL